MPDALRVVPVADRTSRIAQAAVLRQHYMPFKGQASHDVKAVPLDLLVYRLTNMRTDVMQLEFILERGKPASFFSAGQEDPEAQAAQHSFLLTLAKDPQKNIYEKLATIAEQVEPLAVTKSGVVLNGNRRLAAMRVLFEQNPATYSRFQNVQVAILPEADESELTALETDLQIAEDLRLPYGWVEEARGLRRQINSLGWDYPRAESHWGKKVSELKAILSRLDLAEEYLAYRGKPQHFALVAGDEQAFITLQKELASDTAGGVDASEVEARKLVVFAVLAQPPGTISGSSHSYAAKIDDITSRVLADPAITAVTGWVPTTPTVAAPLVGAAAATAAPIPADPPPEADPAADPLATLPAAPGARVPPAVLAVLKDLTKAKAIAAAADQARDDMGDEARRMKRGTALAKSAQAINSTAATLSITNASNDSLSEAAAQLVAAIPSISECLRQILAERPAIAAEIDWGPLRDTASQLTSLARTERN